MMWSKKFLLLIAVICTPLLQAAKINLFCGKDNTDALNELFNSNFAQALLHNCNGQPDHWLTVKKHQNKFFLTVAPAKFENPDYKPPLGLRRWSEATAKASLDTMKNALQKTLKNGYNKFQEHLKKQYGFNFITKR